MKKSIYSGLFFVALATLMFEILLTRIFSVTMWFHFAFVAISVAMFGMTVGALWVYLKPGFFTEKGNAKNLTLFSNLFALSIPLSFLIHLYIPFKTNFKPNDLFLMMLNYAVISIPFIFSGVCVCLCLTKFSEKVGKLYAVDLIGAAAGSFLLMPLLGFADGCSAVFFVSFAACLGTISFALASENKKNIKISALFASVILAVACVNIWSGHTNGTPLLRVRWVKSYLEAKPLYERWNSFSRITVDPDPNGKKAFGWGLSSAHENDEAPEELWLRIDSGAATPITRFDGDLIKHEYLKYDVTNIAHYLKSSAEMLVIGTGGGRDILSALVFDQKKITGLEINNVILDTLNKKYADFSGHLDRNPKVKFVNDEARSYVARSKDKYDIIQVSLIDTTAATAAGAFVFTENALYTKEAWRIFYDHLSPEGMLSFSRWYYLDFTGEIYRTLSLAGSTLRSSGVSDPRQYVICVKNVRQDNLADVGTLLVSKKPFTHDDVAKLEKVCEPLNFKIALCPFYTSDEMMPLLLKDDPGSAIKNYPIRLDAPTDNNPFFFSMIKPWGVFNKKLWSLRIITFNMKAVFVLLGLVIVVTVLTFLCIFLPLRLSQGKLLSVGKIENLHLIYFSSIGFAFMFVEISQMQRLNIFLGHPVYGLTVALAGLLVSSGIGSFFAQSAVEGGLMVKGRKELLRLVLIISVVGLCTPFVTKYFQGQNTPVRIAVALILLFPMGFMMGKAFPVGMAAASKYNKLMTPWLWGANGATSVFASVLAVAVALSFGIGATFLMGIAAYLLAFMMFMRISTDKLDQ